MRSANEKNEKPGLDQVAASASDAKQQSGGKPSAGQRDMGTALRQVYQQTIEEKIPDDLLDLLGKLD